MQTQELRNNGVYQGIHLYVNIRNLNQVIRREEKKSDNLKRVFHAMDNYVSTAEAFINTYNDQVYVEKLTNSRLHIVFYNTETIASNFIEIIKFFYTITTKLNNDYKYQKLIDFQISMGADYGYFTEFDFSPESNNSFIEYTSIGYSANRAAKLESVSDIGELIISKEAFDIIKVQLKSSPVTPDSGKSNKVNYKYYNSNVYSFTDFNNIESTQRFDTKMNIANDRYISNIQNKRFGDIIFTDANKKIDFDNLSLLSPKKIDAVVIYADIRGFTKKFKADGSNLMEMSKLTKEILQLMYKSVITKEGSHVQFQGDRESALRNDYGTGDYVLNGLQVAMFILESVSKAHISTNNNLQIGIGCSYGAVFASKVGIRNHKHNLIMGETVKDANEAEDLIAGNNELAITKDMYQYLANCLDGKYKQLMKEIFNPKGSTHYVTTITYTDFTNKLFRVLQNKNAIEAKENNAQRPWHDQVI